MKPISIFNDVIGPIMRGPSSSHTAAAFRFGSLARSFLGEEPVLTRIVFDKGGSYALVFREQNSDLALAAGLLGWEITDSRFFQAIDFAASHGYKFEFMVEPVEGADHPNFVQLELISATGKKFMMKGRSVGGGAIEIVEVNGWPLFLTGDYYELLVETSDREVPAIRAILESETELLAKFEIIKSEKKPGRVLVRAALLKPISDYERKELSQVEGVIFWEGTPVSFVVSGKTLFKSAEEIISIASSQKMSLGKLALAYEAQLLNWSEEKVLAEMTRRLDIMLDSVKEGLETKITGMKLLEPTAGLIFQAEKEGRLTGGCLSRAAIRALAAEHVAASGGVVCAAPTGGSAGTIPGVISTLVKEMNLSREKACLALLAAGAVGLIVANRATFAAEIAGCQVEIGAAGAMGAAAVVEAAGGTAEQACDAAAISFQNTMGLVCDLVQGICEIPCHTRNAVAAANAFVCADLILGGYKNPIPLDETIDAVLAVGKTMPPELRVTSLGGLAVCPSALRLKKKERKN
jgi:L-serine dehydratase